MNIKHATPYVLLTGGKDLKYSPGVDMEESCGGGGAGGAGRGDEGARLKVWQ